VIRWGPAGVSLALVVLASCTQVSDRDRFEGPETPLRVLLTVPSADATGVSPTPQIDLCMSGLIDPRSIAEDDTSVSSGSALFDSEVSIQLMPWIAPGGGEVDAGNMAPWCTGSVLSATPLTPLTPGARFRVQMRPTARGWAGETLQTEGPGWVVGADGELHFDLEFTVGEATEEPDGGVGPGRGEEPEPELPTLTSLFENGGPFDPARELCSCHRDPDDLAMDRLDLTDPVVAFEDLLGSGVPRDTGFAMITPRDPSQSFFIHKLLRDRDDERLEGILGDAMPVGGPPIPYSDYVAIARWVEAGALP